MSSELRDVTGSRGEKLAVSFEVVIISDDIAHAIGHYVVMKQPLKPEQLRWRCDPRQFPFSTTDELEGLAGIVGQARAESAMEFGVGMRRDGYNLYVLGPPGAGKRTAVKHFLQQRAKKERTPDDWCYVNNFERPDKPNALRVPAGRGGQFKQDMAQLVEDLQTAIPAALESDEHRHRLDEAQREFKDQHEETLRHLADTAHARDLELIRTPTGIALAPARDGEVISPEDYDALPEEEKKQIEHAVKELQPDLQEIVKQLPRLKKQAREKAKGLNRETTSFAIGHLLAQLKESYQDLPEVVDHLATVEADVVEHSEEFCASEEEIPAFLGVQIHDHFRRYEVNLLVDNHEGDGAPVVYEAHPYFHNLIGRVEHLSQMGSLVTDFTLIKAGALHRANGGYLVVQIRDVLWQPLAWEGLKSALRSGEICIESLGAAMSLISTVSIDPEPIPLDVKVVLLGDRMLYYLLRQHDPDFADLFKVAVDFNDQIDRSEESCQLYARLIAAQAKALETRPMDATAVASALEHTARLASDSEKLTTHMRSITDLIRESDYWADRGGAAVITAAHVKKTIEQQLYRADRIRERVQEEIVRGTMLIDTSGRRVAQVNGLSVLDLGDFAFGRPSRITATAHLGRGKVVDIEREVELGGAIHSKGVLILSSLLASRYARDQHLSVTASLVFEQSYGMVDGDSASVAELCAILSALSELPLRQDLAVTGSVNQHGEAQAIGGVNEKIEGFFDVCAARKLTGDQGVLIPRANVKHLMLRPDVVAAAADGKFHIYDYEHVDEAMSLLAGVPAGSRGDDGCYPEGSVNYLVERRLKELSELARKFDKPQPGEGVE